jgi:pyruvate/2-oxoglutarate dehydrogenase complex dihydrolipoamide acyltransferase (E2) component
VIKKMVKQNVRSRTLKFSERWFHDGLMISGKPAYHQSLEVDFERVQRAIARAKEHGVRLTYAHVLVRAAALALAANPDLHTLLCGNRVFGPKHVDIGLSISADTSVVPVLRIDRADEKSVQAIALQIAGNTNAVRKQHEDLIALLDRWGWLVPFRFLRQSMLRMAFRSFRFRHHGCGTLQVSVMPGVDVAATPLFNTAAILVAGQVKDRVVAVDGVPKVLPTAHLTCSADHRVWNGQAGLRFLRAVQEVLAGDQLEEECLAQAVATELGTVTR